MKGNNTIELNGAMMIDAVQYWLSAQFVQGPEGAVDPCERQLREHVRGRGYGRGRGTGMSQRFETPKQRAERRKRNRIADGTIAPLLNLSKRAMRRLGHTKTYRSVELHRDNEQHVVARGRFDMGFHDRSRYAP